MNKRLMAFLLLILIGGNLIAQPGSPALISGQQPLTYKSHRIKINPISLAAGHLSSFYEQALPGRISLTAGFGTGGTGYNFGYQLTPGGAVYQRATLEVRRYAKPQQQTGFYAGAYLRLTRLTVSQFSYDQLGQVRTDSQGTRLTTQTNAFIWAPGVLAGWQIMVKRFCLDGFAGLQRQIKTASSLGSNQLVEGITADWAPRIGLSVGLAF